jgi:hypothetical protein
VTHLSVVRIPKRIDRLVEGLKGEDLMVCYLWVGKVVLSDLKGGRAKRKEKGNAMKRRRRKRRV